MWVVVSDPSGPYVAAHPSGCASYQLDRHGAFPLFTLATVEQVFDGGRVEFWVQVPAEWGPRQFVKYALERAGCHVEVHHVIGRGEVWFKVTRAAETPAH